MLWFVGILLFVFSFGYSEDRSDVVVDTEIVPGNRSIESSDLTPNSFVGEDLTGNASDESSVVLSTTASSDEAQEPKDEPLVVNPESMQSEDGIRSTFYEDGTLKEEVTYVNGRKNGLVRRWFGNGQLKCRGQMMNDRWNGVYEEWFENGESKTIGAYLDGRQMENGSSLINPERKCQVCFCRGKEVTRELPRLFQSSLPFRFNSVEEGSP